jgi:hypothetical protein
MSNESIINSPREEIEIKYEPGPTAIRFHNSIARVKVAWGPVRSGKSTAACWRIFLKAHELAQKGVALKAVILRDTYRNLEDTTLKTWMEWFGQCGVLKRKQSVTDFMLRTPGSELWHDVLFRHGQTAVDASAFLSSDYGIIFLEEAAPAFTPSGLVSPGIAEEVFDLAITRLVQTGVDNPELVITCNPPTPQHWVNRRIISAPLDDLRNRNWWHFFFPAAENEMNLRPGYYDELRAQLKGKDHILRRFVEGEIVAIYPGMPVFAKDFRQQIHVRDELLPIDGDSIIFGFDAGESITPAAVWLQIDAHGRVLVLQELQAGYTDERLREGIGTREFAKIIKQITAQRFPHCKPGLVYADPAVSHRQPGDTLAPVKEILEAEGFVIEESERDIPSRIESIRERLQTFISGEPSILFSRSGCPILIEALSGAYRYRTIQDATRIIGAEPVKDMYSNPIDALGYALARLFPVGRFSQLIDGGRKPTVKTSWSLFHRSRQ